ncbi:MAG: hypothetical protein ACHQWH_02490 [Nitrososphaerales archaeon]|jgi:hypothetical protein
MIATDDEIKTLDQFMLYYSGDQLLAKDLRDELHRKRFEIVKQPDNMTIALTNSSGKKAVIDFSGDEVIYEGDLPISAAAKVLFMQLGHLLKGGAQCMKA